MPCACQYCMQAGHRSLPSVVGVVPSEAWVSDADVDAEEGEDKDEGISILGRQVRESRAMQLEHSKGLVGFCLIGRSTLSAIGTPGFPLPVADAGSGVVNTDTEAAA